MAKAMTLPRALDAYDRTDYVSPCEKSCAFYNPYARTCVIAGLQTVFDKE